MTTIKSLLGAATLEVTVRPKSVMLTLHRGQDEAFGAFEPAELLAALDAEPKSVAEALRKELGLANMAADEEAHEADRQKAHAEMAEAKLADAEAERDEYRDGYGQLMERNAKLNGYNALMTEQRDEARAERDAHTATIGRLKASLRDVVMALGPVRICECGPDDEGCGLREEAADALKTAKAALEPEPEPAFVLPTEAGSVIIATVDETGQEHELHLYRDGKWRDDTETWYWPKDVLTDFTDHRLLEAAE